MKVTAIHTGSIRRDRSLLNDAELFYPHCASAISMHAGCEPRGITLITIKKTSVHAVAVTLPKL